MKFFLLLIFATVSLQAGDKILKPSEAAAHVGQTAVVQGTVNVCFQCRMSNSDQWKLFLGEEKAFCAIVPDAILKSFSPKPAAVFENKRIQVKGKITSYKDHSEIVVSRKEQIRLVP